MWLCRILFQTAILIDYKKIIILQEQFITMNEVDLNCDMGEGFGNSGHNHDEELMQYVSSVNIACGFHAGDAAIMQQTVAAAHGWQTE